MGSLGPDLHDRVETLRFQDQEPVGLARAFLSIFVGEGGSDTSWTAGLTLDEVARAAGVQRFTCHDLHRTFATGLARAGVNQMVASDMIGHSSETVTAKCNQAVDDEAADQALVKPPDVPARGDGGVAQHVSCLRPVLVEPPCLASPHFSTENAQNEHQGP